MDVIQKFFTAKSLRIIVLDGMQSRIRYYSPFSIYINYRNHHLTLRFSHLMKDICLEEIISDYDTLLLCLWEIFHFSPKRSSILESFQVIYGKEPITLLKVAATCWLTHDRDSEYVIDYLLEILEALNQIYIDADESWILTPWP